MNLLVYGEFLDNFNDYFVSNFLFLCGVIINGCFDEIYFVDLIVFDEIQEFVIYFWYIYGNGNNDKGLYLWDGLIEL